MGGAIWLALAASTSTAAASTTAPGFGAVLEVMQPTLLSEVDYRAYPRAEEGNTGFALARLRTGLVLSPSPWLRVVATMEWAGEGAIVLDAYATLEAHPAVAFTVGYAKPPLFASFVLEPVHTTPFPDRAPVVSAFRIRRDLGVSAHFTPASLPLEVWLRVGNGTGSPLGNDNAAPAVYGGLDLVLGRARAGVEPSEAPFGLRLGAAGLVEDTLDRDGVAGRTPFGFNYYRPAVVSGLRGVVEGHAVAYLGPLRALVEGAWARESRSRDDDGNPTTPRLALDEVDSGGLTAELAWVIRGGPRAVGRAPTDPDGSGWSGGAFEVAARVDRLWLGRGTSDVEGGGATAGGLAARWWATDFIAASVAGYLTRYDVPPLETPDEAWSWGAVARLSLFWGQTQANLRR